MILKFFWQRALLVFVITVFFTANSMAGPRVTKTLEVKDPADAPYHKILVIALAEKYQAGKKFEHKVLDQLSRYDTNAVASTSLRDITIPATKEVFLAMIDSIDADAVLVTQVASVDSKVTMTDASPEATYNVRPTYYFNVWNVELTEYVEPQFMGMDSELVLATELYSVQEQDAVWAIESASRIVEESGQPGYYPFFEDEAKAITKHLKRDRLIVK